MTTSHDFHALAEKLLTEAARFDQQHLSAPLDDDTLRTGVLKAYVEQWLEQIIPPAVAERINALTQHPGECESYELAPLLSKLLSFPIVSEDSISIFFDGDEESTIAEYRAIGGEAAAVFLGENDEKQFIYLKQEHVKFLSDGPENIGAWYLHEHPLQRSDISPVDDSVQFTQRQDKFYGFPPKKQTDSAIERINSMERELPFDLSPPDLPDDPDETF